MWKYYHSTSTAMNTRESYRILRCAAGFGVPPQFQQSASTFWTLQNLTACCRTSPQTLSQCLMCSVGDGCCWSDHPQLSDGTQSFRCGRPRCSARAALYGPPIPGTAWVPACTPNFFRWVALRPNQTWVCCTQRQDLWPPLSERSVHGLAGHHFARVSSSSAL